MTWGRLRMRSLRDLSIVWKLTIAATATTVIAVVLTGWLSFRNSRDLLLAAAIRSMEESMSRQVERMTNVLDGARNDAQLVSQSEAVKGILRARAASGYDDSTNMTEADWKRQLERVFTVMLKSKGYQQVRLIGFEDNGREIVRVDAPRRAGEPVRLIRGTDLQAKGDRSYMLAGKTLNRGQTYVSPINLNRERGAIQQPWQPTQRFVAPVFDEGGSCSASVAVVVINMDANKVMDAMEDGGAFSVILTNDAGGILRHPDPSREWKFEFGRSLSLENEVPRVWRGILGSGKSVVWQSGDQDVHVTGRVPLGHGERFLGLVMTAREEDVAADVAGLRTETAAISIAAIMATCALCVFGVRRLTRPMSVLTKQADQLAAGVEGVRLSAAGRDEVGRLGRSFANLVDQLQQRTEEAKRSADDVRNLNASLEQKVELRTAELAKQEAHTRAILTSAPDAIITIDSEGVVRQFNPAAARIFGHESDAIIGRNVTTLIPPSFKQRHVDGLARFFDTHEVKILNKTVEVEGLHKDGTTFPLELTINEILVGDDRWFTAIGRDISERKEADEALRTSNASMVASLDREKRAAMQLEEAMFELGAAKRSAEAASRAKSEFLANMSHEIRTPMTAILGFTENMLAVDHSDSERLNALQTVRRNGEHLLQLINDILDISKIEAGKLQVEHIRCSPVQLAADVQSLMQVRADAKGLPFNLEYIGAVPETIQSDPTRLKQILVNLIGNAIKFTETGGVKLVTRFVDTDPIGGTGPAEPMMQFDIVDTGIGMNAEQAGKLFQAFTQADTSTTRKFGGTGLGLHISKRLAEMLGGDITIDSKPGEGSTFRVAITTGPLDGVRMLDDPAKATIVQPESAALSVGGAAQAEACGSQALDCRILLAEDGKDNQRLISFILKKAGADVAVAENGKLALDAALAARDEGSPFGAILMDIQMPVMDGYEATKQLRENGYIGPIIALTAHAMASDRQKCLDAGCDEYATKPIDRKKLIATIHEWRRKRPVQEKEHVVAIGAQDEAAL